MSAMGISKPSPTFSAHHARNFRFSTNCLPYRLLSLANCYFADDSSGFPVLIRFCDAKFTQLADLPATLASGRKQVAYDEDSVGRTFRQAPHKPRKPEAAICY